MAKTDTDRIVEIAILLGAEWKTEEIARHYGITRQAVDMRIARYREHIDRVKAFTRVAISKKVEERLTRAEEDLQERKKKIHSKGYKLIEKKINLGLEDGVDPDSDHLRAAEIGIERTEGKALDRKAILGRMDVYRHDVDGDELDEILGEVAKINEIRRLALPAAPDEVLEE